LLQIVDDVPKEYEIIHCCFADFKNKAHYCYCKFGLDRDNYLLKNSVGERFQGIPYSVWGKRGLGQYVRVKKQGENASFIPEFADKK
jgi:hypothetical protein